MKNVKGYGFFIVLLLVIGISYLFNSYLVDYNRDAYSISQFKQDLSDKKIKKILHCSICYDRIQKLCYEEPWLYACSHR